MSEKPEAKCAAQVQRSSLRVTKRPRKDVSPPPNVSSNPPPASNAAASKKSSVSKQGNADSGRARRAWELWSPEDKDAFFEAVCEFGKDFESIQSYIAQRGKKKGVSMHCIKNKDQVRHFYYRTWHKIAKVMNIGEGHEDVKKQTQELYGLINYAELRKKYSASLNEKNGQLLTELVLTGSTMVKIRGKRIRIKTPVCRALKKINNVEETKYEEPPKLPADVWVEFRPRTNGAWVQVQSLAQNPRVRTRTSLQRRLANVLEHLQARWKPLRLRQKEQAVASLAGVDCKALALVEAEVAQELRVWPSVPISPVSISAMAASSLGNVSFQGLRKKAALADSSAGKATAKPARPAKQPRAPKVATAAATTGTATTTTASAGTTQDSSTAAAVEAGPSTAEPTQAGNAAGAESTAESSRLSSPPPERVAEESPEDEAAKSLTLLRSMLEPEPPATSVAIATESANSAASEQVPPAVPAPPAPPPPPPPVVPPPSVAMAIESVESILPECNAEAEGLTLGQLLGKAAEEARQGGDEEVEGEDEEEQRRREKELEEREKEQQELLEAQAKRKEEEERARERSAKGWTAQEAGLMTIGELYLMMGCPNKIVLHYDFCPVEQKESDKSKTTVECTAMLKKLLSLATAMFAEKNKQGPLSPPAGKCGSGGAATGGRGSASSSGTPPSGKSAASRALGRSPSTKPAPRPTLQQVQQAQQAEQALEDAAAAAAGEGAPSQPVQGPAGDQHVFVVPMGLAPRTHKQAAMTATAAGTANMLERGQLDRLVAANRRGVRMRPLRKPLVVQRPLLPRADRRPVTLVQLLPSSPATLAAVVQPLAATAAAAEPQGGLVKLIHPTAGASLVGAAFDVQPVQVPLIEASALPSPASAHPVVAAAAVEATSTAAVLVASQPAQQQQQPAVVALQQAPPPAVDNLAAAAVVDGPTPNLAESADMNRPHTADALGIAAATPIRVQPPSPPSISSLLDISLPESLPSDGTATQILVDGDTLPSFTGGNRAELTTLPAINTDSPVIETSNPLPSFAQVTESSLAKAFQLAVEEATGVVSAPPEPTPTISKTEGLTTPPMSPFKLAPAAPDPTWLNGESSDFSLSTLLNTLDSPLKAVKVEPPRVVPEAPILALETSTMDSISRMAPDVDTHLQCLMNENSIDYVAKFADLAAKIASSNSENKSS